MADYDAMTISNLRREYQADGLNEHDLDADPIVQFNHWFNDALAAEVVDANAMTLATASADGTPSARIVLIKGCEPTGITFFTNYESDKAEDLAANPKAAVVFYWSPLHRQVRIRGAVTKVSRGESEKYFHMRPRGAQIGAAASDQSKPLASREQLDRRAAELDKQYQDKPIACPTNWGGYLLTPLAFEFWQGRPDRLHDRFRYTQQADDTWTITRLAP